MCTPRLSGIVCLLDGEDLMIMFVFLAADNRLIENYSVVLVRCTDQERDILSLRQENTDLQRSNVR